jgi:hypothetical protein
MNEQATLFIVFIIVIGLLSLGGPRSAGTILSDSNSSINTTEHNVSNETDVLAGYYDRYYRPGGGSSAVTGGIGSLPANNTTSAGHIVNVSICLGGVDNQTCNDGNSNNVSIFWRVEDGIGCCATYHCSYKAFSDACLRPIFGLYNVYFDNVLIPRDVMDYEYVCENKIPWNYAEFYNVSLGAHEIAILQKDCGPGSVDFVRVTFNLLEGYAIEGMVIHE